MRRRVEKDLDSWLESPRRKPLVIRGARQTGKTWLVRDLAARHGLDLVEVNFERDPELGTLFSPGGPAEVLPRLSAALGREIDWTGALLFLDEVQAAPEVLARLRYFYEERPDLPVVAAGSLLEFALKEFKHSMPVGRVSYFYLCPMTFEEFLWAAGEKPLADFLQASVETAEVPAALHEKALELFRAYTVVGGMPEAVETWAETLSLFEVQDVQQTLLVTFQDDFNKYRDRVPAEALRATLRGIVRQMGEKFVYSHVDEAISYKTAKRAVEMLVDARLGQKVNATHAKGLPLDDEVDERDFKVLFLDHGLAMKILGLEPIDATQLERCVWSNKGALGEQMVGQSLLAAATPRDKRLFYWSRGGSATAEIDFVTQRHGAVLPIEVKSGAAGKMRSLHLFMQERGLEHAWRFDLNPPSSRMVEVEVPGRGRAFYRLDSWPLYMACFLGEEG
ncbi:ATP-binding protein [Kribbibacterium absianum]|uniref:ATP-binding protein n=1 Tax=Kribbibacterium absianum TaxID=3044210 RepID=UPI0024BCB58D|nr:AAA family ATPase [Olsenella sp. YH-ols2216]MDJ1122631.1 AAA family ATPase [Olsenella sp. YH-ols2216]